jgi:hypothetical protein
VQFNRKTVFIVHSSGALTRITATKAIRLVVDGLASKVGRDRIRMLPQRGEVPEDGYDLRGRQSGYGGPTVIQRVPLMKPEDPGCR